ncbi:GNAT family N-acetyltransferase [Neolewinella persica]|uniref:GNAT family N-acetyltransferase n=1 Tax=Neolewinella persica TaxID=70998 RepID=UPI00037A0244|nr:GNAT family N-acetyltransferase [Neolewinella persica]
MENEIRIKVVNTPKDLQAFIRLPWVIYKKHPNWVPPLMAAQKSLFDFERNPFWKTHEHALFMVMKRGQISARIAVFIPKVSEDSVIGHFGFLETINDQEVFNQLLSHSHKWFQQRGIKEVMGPFNPSIHHESGVLQDSFEERPFIMMPYNPPYYPEFYQRAGFEKAMDFCAYSIPRAEKILDARLIKVTDKLMLNLQLSIRSANKKRPVREFDILHRLYNRSFEDHWGFENLSKEAFNHLATDLMQIADPDLLLIAEKEGVPVGFVLCVPNFNEVLQEIPNGKLWPLGIFKLLWYRRKIKTVRVMTTGVLPEFRDLGIGLTLMRRLTEIIISKGYSGGEISWVAENNPVMNKAATSIGGRPYKKICIYQLKIT